MYSELASGLLPLIGNAMPHPIYNSALREVSLTLTLTLTLTLSLNPASYLNPSTNSDRTPRRAISINRPLDQGRRRCPHQPLSHPMAAVVA